MRSFLDSFSAASVLLLATTLIAGCDMLVDGQGTPPAQGTVAPAKAPPAAKAEQPEELEEIDEPVDDYTYNPIGKRDPFRSFLSLGNRGRDPIPRTPLQKFELDEYQLVGIVWGVERPRALVEDPQGVGYVMEIGTYIGKNWGKVTQISPSEVMVTEEYQTIDGELVVNTLPMSLPVDTLQEVQ